MDNPFKEGDKVKISEGITDPIRASFKALGWDFSKIYTIEIVQGNIVICAEKSGSVSYRHFELATSEPANIPDPMIKTIEDRFKKYGV